MQLSALRPGSEGELQALAANLNLGITGTRLAAKRGLLWFLQAEGNTDWIVTDSKRVYGEALRLDPGLWPNGSQVRQCIGNCASWPVGIQEAADHPLIVLVDRPADLLAAFQLAWEADRHGVTAPVLVTGAEHQIHPEALPLFAGKKVALFSFGGDAGMAQAEQRGQLLRGVAQVEIIPVPSLLRIGGAEIRNLADLAALSSPWSQWTLQSLAPAAAFSEDEDTPWIGV